MSTKSRIEQASTIEQAHAIAAERALITKVVWPKSEVARVFNAAHTAAVQAAAPKLPKATRLIAHPDTGKPIGSRALLSCTLVPMNADLPTSTALVAFQHRQYPRVVRVDVEAGVLGKADHPVSVDAFERLKAGKRTSLAFTGEVYLARVLCAR